MHMYSKFNTNFQIENRGTIFNSFSVLNSKCEQPKRKRQTEKRMKFKLSSLFISLTWAFILHSQLLIILALPQQESGDDFNTEQVSSSPPPFSSHPKIEAQNKIVEEQKFIEKILELSDGAIEDFTLKFQQLKSRLTLYTLEKIIPEAQALRLNLSLALENSDKNIMLKGLVLDNQVSETNQNYSLTPISLDLIAIGEELNAQLRGVETDLNSNRDAVKTINRMLRKTEENFMDLSENLIDALEDRFPDIHPDADSELQSHLESESESKKFGCGGRIDVSIQSELLVDTAAVAVHRGKRKTCVWLLFSSKSTGFNVMLTNMSRFGESLSPWTSTLSLHWDFTEPKPRNRIISTLGETLELNTTAILVLSKSKSTIRPRSISRGWKSHQKFSLHFSLTGSGSTDSAGQQNKELYSNYLLYSNETEGKAQEDSNYGIFHDGRMKVAEIKYPETSGDYMNNERHFFTLFPYKGTRISLNLLKIDVENGYDYLSILRFNKEENIFELLTRESGADRKGLLGSFTGNLNAPVLLYFHSDANTVRTGFTFTFQSV